MPPSSENKTEKPTPRRRRRAREQGEVAQSNEVNNVLVLFAGAGALALFGGRTFGVLVGFVTEHLGSLHDPEITAAGTIRLARQAVGAVMDATLPIMLSAGIVGLVVSLAQTGLVFAPKKLSPKLSELNPIKGFKQLFSLSALQRVAVAVLKFAIIGVISYVLVRNRIDWLLALVGKSVYGIAQVAGSLSFSLMSRVLAAMLVVAILDYAFQRWRYEKRLMMTKQEVKEERKREEGDAEVQARRHAQRRAMTQRMISAVPDANVVVTNPDHFAVALKWDEEGMDAPVVVAKGKNHMAERIKRAAREHDVPVLERRPLARALFSAVEVGMEIPPKLYYAVAEVLAFVLKDRAA